MTFAKSLKAAGNLPYYRRKLSSRVPVQHLASSLFSSDPTVCGPSGACLCFLLCSAFCLAVSLSSGQAGRKVGWSSIGTRAT